jgi:hypothetical protein
MKAGSTPLENIVPRSPDYSGGMISPWTAVEGRGHWWAVFSTDRWVHPPPHYEVFGLPFKVLLLLKKLKAKPNGPIFPEFLLEKLFL